MVGIAKQNVLGMQVAVDDGCEFGQCWLLELAMFHQEPSLYFKLVVHSVVMADVMSGRSSS